MSPTSRELTSLVFVGLLVGCAAAARPVVEGAPEPTPKPSPVTSETTALPAPSSPGPAPSAVASVEPPSRVPWRANEDPSDDQVGGPPEPFSGCGSLLKQMGVRHRPATQPVRPQARSAQVCGVAQAVAFLGGPGDLSWGSPATVSCGMAIALARWERVLREEAERHLHQALRSVVHGVPYQCRQIVGAMWPSEHSYANALDVFGFRLADGTVLSVKLQFGPTTAPEGATPEARFLRSVSRRAFDEGIFSNVLTPYFNAAHHDHLHLDLGRYRVDGTR